VAGRRSRQAALENMPPKSVQHPAMAAERGEDPWGGHVRRVGRLSARIAQTLALPPAEVDLIQRAARLHDVGKSVIPPAILLKPGPLTPREFEQMKSHTTLGARMLSGRGWPVLRRAEVIALTHHERWDGLGYLGLAGAAIPMASRIVTLADVYDALVAARPYKLAWPVADAIAEIRRQSGRQFDPRVVDAFLRLAPT
jgi:putative two-component system response regulator